MSQVVLEIVVASGSGSALVLRCAAFAGFEKSV